MLMLFFGIASAQSTLKLAFQKLDDSIERIEAKSLTITFANGNLSASNGTENLEIKLSDLVKMYFTDGDSGTNIVSVDFNEIEADVYTIDGKNCGKFTSVAEAVASLPAGIYIIKTSDDKSFKIAVQ